ncbi:hypothetical protein, partial [Xanthomonas axonopodis]
LAQEADDLLFGKTLLHVQSPWGRELDSKLRCYSKLGGRRAFKQLDTNAQKAIVDALLEDSEGRRFGPVKYVARSFDEVMEEREGIDYELRSVDATAQS